MRVALTLLFVWLSSVPMLAIFAFVPADRVTEVPIDRLLANLGRNPDRLTPPEWQRAVGRVHLLAYLRGVVTLPVLRDHPSQLADGTIDDCSLLDPPTAAEQRQIDVRIRAGRPPVVRPPTGERCLTPTFSLAPRPEIPVERDSGRPASDRHLAEARTAYEAARALDPSDLRTHVALAFVYDRSGLPPQAAAELRLVLRDGLKRFPVPGKDAAVDWETHVVVSEALGHFLTLANSRADQQLRSRVVRRLKDTPPALSITPILVPVDADAPFESLVDRSSDVAFDFAGQEVPIRGGWITPKAAWLVWDPDRRQRIIGGFQLFGSVTWMSFWGNGYRALALLDDNGDGRIDGHELAGLALWHDADADGVCDALEVDTVASYGIVSVAYDHERVSDELWRSPRGVTYANGNQRPTYDWVVRGRPIR